MSGHDNYYQRAKVATDSLREFCWKKEGTCKQCRKRSVKISINELCQNCATENMANSAKQLHEKKGRYFNKWKQNLIKAAREA